MAIRGSLEPDDGFCWACRLWLQGKTLDPLAGVRDSPPFERGTCGVIPKLERCLEWHKDKVDCSLMLLVIQVKQQLYELV